MARHSRKHNRQFYTYGATKVPSVTQDRYYSADWVRDMRYNESLAARAMLDLLGVSSVLVSGGLITQGSSVTKVNITAAVGFCDFDVEVPADDQTWVVPPPFETRQIAVTARCPSITDFNLSATSMVFDGSTPNYLKLKYLENNVQARSRKYGATTYSYSIEDSYALACDTSAVTAKDVLLATLVGNGTSALTITQNTATAKVLKAANADTSAACSGNAATATTAAACSGNAATATVLQTARTIGGVSFDGSTNINLPGVNTTGNQDTSGNAASATSVPTGAYYAVAGATITAIGFSGHSGMIRGILIDGSGNISGFAVSNTIATYTVPSGYIAIYRAFVGPLS